MFADIQLYFKVELEGNLVQYSSTAYEDSQHFNEEIYKRIVNNIKTGIEQTYHKKVISIEPVSRKEFYEHVDAGDTGSLSITGTEDGVTKDDLKTELIRYIDDSSRQTICRVNSEKQKILAAVNNPKLILTNLYEKYWWDRWTISHCYNCDLIMQYFFKILDPYLQQLDSEITMQHGCGIAYIPVINIYYKEYELMHVDIIGKKFFVPNDALQNTAHIMMEKYQKDLAKDKKSLKEMLSYGKNVRTFCHEYFNRSWKFIIPDTIFELTHKNKILEYLHKEIEKKEESIRNIEEDIASFKAKADAYDASFQNIAEKCRKFSDYFLSIDYEKVKEWECCY